MATKLQAAKKLYKALVGKRSSQTSVAGVLDDLEQNFFAEPKMRLLLHIPAGDLTGMTNEVFDMSEEGEPFNLHKVVIIWRGTLTASGSVRAKINEDTVWHVSSSGAGSTSKVGKMVIDITSGFLCATQTAAANNGSSGAVSEIVPAQPSKEWDAIKEVTVGASAGMFTEFFELYIFGC